MYGKNPGGQKFWQRGEGRFREILSCPPPQMRVAPQMPPPQIPRPGAATGNNRYDTDTIPRIFSGIDTKF